jgi:hypothetical protein
VSALSGGAALPAAAATKVPYALPAAAGASAIPAATTVPYALPAAAGSAVPAATQQGFGAGLWNALKAAGKEQLDPAKRVLGAITGGGGRGGSQPDASTTEKPGFLSRTKTGFENAMLGPEGQSLTGSARNEALWRTRLAAIGAGLSGRGVGGALLTGLQVGPGYARDAGFSSWIGDQIASAKTPEDKARWQAMQQTGTDVLRPREAARNTTTQEPDPENPGMARMVTRDPQSVIITRGEPFARYKKPRDTVDSSARTMRARNYFLSLPPAERDGLQFRFPALWTTATKADEGLEPFMAAMNQQTPAAPENTGPGAIGRGWDQLKDWWKDDAPNQSVDPGAVSEEERMRRIREKYAPR